MFLPLMFLNDVVNDFYSIFNTITKTKVTSNQKANRSKIQHCWFEIFLHFIRIPSFFFD